MGAYELLNEFALNPDRYVLPFQIKERNKTRTIITYNKAKFLGKALRRAHEETLASFTQHFAQRNPHSFAYQKGVRTSDAIIEHRASNYFIKLDIHHFFESITFAHFLEAHPSFNAHWKKILSGCFYKGSLSIGFVTSPALSDFYMRDFDEAVESYLQEHEGLHYSRYCDDMLLSSEDDEGALEALFQFVVDHLRALHLELNEKKTRRVLLDYASHNSISFLGLNLSKENEVTNKVTISKRYILLLLFLIEKSRKYTGYCIGLENEIRSRVAYLAYNSPVSFARFQKKHIARFGKPYAFLTKEREKRIAAIATSGIQGFDEYSKLFKLNIHGQCVTDPGRRVLVKDGVVIEKYLGKDDAEVVLPPFVEGIMEGAFSRHNEIKKIVLPKRLKYIGKGAFAFCSSLEEISFPESLRFVGEGAFEHTSVKRLVIPGKIIGFARAFKGCDAEEIIFNEGIKKIDNDCCADCSCLSRVEIPSSALEIMPGAFARCVRLKELSLPASLIGIGEGAFEKCLSLRELNVPEGLVSLGQKAFQGCRRLEHLSIPSTLSAIESGCFSSCPNIKKVQVDPSCRAYETDATGQCIIESNTKTLIYSVNGMIPEGIKVLGDRLFRGQDIEEILVPEGVTSIGVEAFAYCYRLKKVSLPKSLERISASAFAHCVSLTEITLPPLLRIIPESLFEGCSRLQEVRCGENIESIKAYAFSGCHSLRFALPSSLRHIGMKAFAGCENIGPLSIPKNLTRIHRLAFFGLAGHVPSLEIDPQNPVYFLEGAKNILADARHGIVYFGVGNAFIPEGVATIENHAFAYCPSLKEISFPSTLRFVRKGAFEGCANLSKVDLGMVNVLGEKAFAGTSSLTKIVFPESLVELGDKAFASSGLTEIVFPKSLTKLGTDCFVACRDVTRLYIPSNVVWPMSPRSCCFPKLRRVDVEKEHPTYSLNEETHALVSAYPHRMILGGSESVIVEGIVEIGPSCFAGNEGLTKIDLPQTVRSIGEAAFMGCPNLEEVNLSVFSIGGKAFMRCPKLSKVDFGENLDSIGVQAFRESLSLEEVVFPLSLRHIRDRAFFASKIKKVDLLRVSAIGSTAFALCENLSEVHLPVEGAAFGNYAFAYSGIKEAVFGKERYALSEGMFAYCPSLTKIELSPDQESIPANFALGCASLTNVSWPTSLERIGASAFAGCVHLKAEPLPSSLSSLQWHAFRDVSSVDKVTLSLTIETLSATAFEGCDLSSIEVQGQDKAHGENIFTFTDPQNALRVRLACKTSVFNEGIDAIDPYVFESYDPEKLPALPDSLRELNVSRPDDKEVFLERLPASLEQLICLNPLCLKPKNGVLALPKGLRTFQAATWNAGTVSSLSIGDQLRSWSVSCYAFPKWNTLTRVEVSPANTEFDDCGGVALRARGSNQIILGLGNGLIPEGVRAIARHAYTRIKATRVVVPEGVRVLGEDFLRESEVEEVVLPSTLDTIGKRFGYHASIKRIVVAENNPYFAVFKQGSALVSLNDMTLLYLTHGGDIPYGVMGAGEYAFSHAGYEHVDVRLPATFSSPLSLSEDVLFDHIAVDPGNPWFTDYGQDGLFVKAKKTLLRAGRYTKIPSGVTTLARGCYAHVEDGFTLELGKDVRFISPTFLGARRFSKVVVAPDNPLFASHEDVALTYRQSDYLIALALGAKLPSSVHALKESVLHPIERNNVYEAPIKPDLRILRASNPGAFSDDNDFPF